MCLLHDMTVRRMTKANPCYCGMLEHVLNIKTLYFAITITDVI